MSVNIKTIYYENFLYIAFVDTFVVNNETHRKFTSEIFSNSELVLTVYKHNYVTVARKEYGNRSQLWRITADGFLVHEGSSPPSELNFNSKIDITNRYVLDVEGRRVRICAFFFLKVCRLFLN
jgi:vacuolar protein sorting-associated protein 13D